MKLLTQRVFSQGCLAAGLAVGLLAMPASAQSESEGAPAPVGTAGQVQTSPIQPTPPAQLTPQRSYWTNNGGFETDSHDTGYGFFGPQFVKPISARTSVVAGANVNYLFYDYANVSGHTRVGAPGVSVRGGMKFGNQNYLQVAAGPSFKRRTIDVMDGADNLVTRSHDIRTGIGFGVDGSADPTSHSNIYGIFDFNSSDNYRWGRLAYKEQITNRSWSGKFAHFLGAEVIGQGNEDIRSTQLGGFFEIAHTPSSISIMLRGGYKVSSFDIGPDKRGPWVAIGFWQRLR
jgi:hypothetical protein